MRSAIRGIFVVYLIVLHGVAIYFISESLIQNYVGLPAIQTAALPGPNAGAEIPTPPAQETPYIDPNLPTPAPVESPSGPVFTAPGAILTIPVAGVEAKDLLDTFGEARGEERSHGAIDIMAPSGTPVLAATDGEIVRFWDSEAGGITIYQMTDDRRLVLYYAHLQRRADDIKPGDRVTRGRVIGYVGDTGNAGTGNFHLRFSVSVVTDPNRYWEGTNINPYPLLTGRPAATDIR
jgi:murein DD-endopeptidase MepM/ murein hydrolase activator NlpD